LALWGGRFSQNESREALSKQIIQQFKHNSAESTELWKMHVWELKIFVLELFKTYLLYLFM
jgi:hypothetical protein